MKVAKTAAEKSMLAILSSLLMAFPPAGATAPVAPVGRMTSTGSVWVNGLAAPAGTNVYAGNEISTGSQAAVEVALARGGKLVLGGSTIARVSVAGQGFSVALDRGVVGVVSESRAPVVLDAYGVTIRTKEPAGAFQVALAGRSLLVLARQGGALVEAVNRTVEVAPGRLLQAGVVPQNPDSRSPAKHKELVLVLTTVTVLGAAAGLALADPSRSPCLAPSPQGSALQPLELANAAFAAACGTCQAVSPSGFTCR